jgi:hypothetical protein
MVNKEQKTKDGFGLPSTEPNKKENALIEAARIADKMAKWYAEFGPFKEAPKVADIDKEVEDAKKAEAERQAKLEAVLAKEKADKKAKLQAELDALDA